MKKNRLMAVAALLFAGIQFCFAQKYEPTDVWPYLYNDFQNGMIRTHGGELMQPPMMNITLDGKIHYIKADSEKILAADMKDVYTARIGNDIYLNANGKMMKVVAENDNGAVLSDTSVDTDEMGKTDIGYGISSSTASTTKLTDLGGGSIVDLPLSTLMERRKEASVLPLEHKNYLWVNVRLIPASKRGVSEDPNIDKDAFKSFLKEHKINWHDPASLLTVVDFIAGKNN